MIILKYIDDEGREAHFEVGTEAVTLGRSMDADVSIADEKLSRYHCAIRQWDDDYILRDLKSRNGTMVNGEAITLIEITPGDKITIGSTVFHVESADAKGVNTLMHEIEDEMAEGHGYHTILKEIVDDADEAKD